MRRMNVDIYSSVSVCICVNSVTIVRTVNQINDLIGCIYFSPVSSPLLLLFAKIIVVSNVTQLSQ